MGIENMRRWPMYIIFAACIMLLLSLLNSWSMETELSNKVVELSTQLQECSKQQSTCMEESLTLLEQRDSYSVKVNALDKQKSKLSVDIEEQKRKYSKLETQVNHTHVDVELCKTELQSLKNLQVSKTAMLETLRLEKDTLTTQLSDRKKRIEELEKEVERLKLALTTKSSNIVASSKATPAAQPPNQSPPLSVNNVMNEPVLDNDAKEDIEEVNALNDQQEFDSQMQ